MPELPEVETIATTLYPHVRGAVFTSAQLLRLSSLHPLSLPLNSLCGHKISEVGRRGKLLLFKLVGQADAPLQLVAHLRMTGRLFTASGESEPGKHTRCVFGLQAKDGESKQLFFDDTRAFGKLLVATQDILEKWTFWTSLGPEPLEMRPEELLPRLKGARPLKTALMDQSVIAGIGNIYADESLFTAGISPLRPASEISENEARKLMDAIQKILRKSISQCGSSIRDYRDADGNAGAFQNTFRVYGRGGKECKKCGATLIKIKLGGRATVYCPDCQS